MSFSPFPPSHDPVDLPRQARAQLGRASLAPGDDSAEYENLLAWAAEAAAPRDAWEWLWLKEAIELVWDVRRKRRARVGFLAAAHTTAVHRVVVLETGAEANSDSYPRVVPAAFRAEAVEAEAWRIIHDWVGSLDKEIMLAERRRDGVLREIDRRRDRLAKRLRPVIEAAGRGGDGGERDAISAAG